MLNLRSFKLLSTESITSTQSQKNYQKTEKRLKELSNLLGVPNKTVGPQDDVGHRLSTKVSTISTSNSGAEKIIAFHWDDFYKALVLLLSNGMLVWCFFDPLSLSSLSFISFDRFLIGKIKTDHIVDLLFDQNRILISYTTSRITLVVFDDKKSKAISSKKKPFKLKSRNVKILDFELDIKCGLRRVERHLILNQHKTDQEEILIVWWQNGSNSVCPWSSPIDSGKDFCNIMVYNVINNGFELLGLGSIMNDILKIEFCKNRHNILITVENDSYEQSVLYREYHICRCQDSGYLIEMIESVRLTIPRKYLKADINLALNRVLILCDSRTVVMYSVDLNTITYFQAPINAIDLINCPLNSYFVMTDNCGQIMMYDYGLHVMSANYDDLFLRETFSGLTSVDFLGNNLLFLRFNDEPSPILVRMPFNLDYSTLIGTYLKNDHINEAIETLRHLNWNNNSYLAYSNLNFIFNYLIRQPLNALIESQLQTTLAAFYIPKVPIDDVIINEYQYEMHCLAKRFFLRLYHYSCLEKAFMLALDLQSRHLFILLYKIAKEKGNTKLAEVSLNYAMKIQKIESLDYSSKCSDKSSTTTSPLHEETFRSSFRRRHTVNPSNEANNNAKSFKESLAPFKLVQPIYEQKAQQISSPLASHIDLQKIHSRDPKIFGQTESNLFLRDLFDSKPVSPFLMTPPRLTKEDMTESLDGSRNQNHEQRPSEFQLVEIAVPPSLPPRADRKFDGELSPSMPPPIPPKPSSKTLISLYSNSYEPVSSKTSTDLKPDAFKSVIDVPSPHSSSSKILPSEENPNGESLPTPLSHHLKERFSPKNRPIKCVHFGLV